jgi:hypothetical protein
VPTQEVLISDSRFHIKADVMIPKNQESNRGIVLVHGAIINRKSLSRDTNSLAAYLCEKLNAYVLTPDYLGDTTYTGLRKFSHFSQVVDCSVQYLCDTFGVDDVMGFGHSMGSYIVVEAANLNDNISHIVTYGGPTQHLLKNREIGFLTYLLRYLNSFDYSVNVKNLLHNLFDTETVRYLKEVMMVEPEYSGDNYEFFFDPELVQKVVESFNNYFDNLKRWGKPAMLLFGENDSLMKKSIKAHPDGYREDNILVKHIKGASHVTPCMDSLVNMKKLDPMLLFHRNVSKVGATNLLT